MERPDPQHAVVALAAFLRRRLSGVSGRLPIWRHVKSGPALAAVRQEAGVIVGATAPFATTSYARARLLRQLHASGLLSQDEADQAAELLQIAQ